jgi:glutamate-1-semialdehyde aminotransferase
VVVVVNNGENTAKATAAMVATIEQLTDVRAEIARLEKIKKSLVSEIEQAFGEATTLIHRNLEVARLDWRSRSNFDNKKFAEVLETTNPEIWKIVKPLFDNCVSVSTYSVITSLFKREITK